LVISNNNSFRVLFDKIASVHFIWQIYLYFSIGNGLPRKPALCQLYQHTFVPYSSDSEKGINPINSVKVLWKKYQRLTTLALKFRASVLVWTRESWRHWTQLVAAGSYFHAADFVRRHEFHQTSWVHRGLRPASRKSPHLASQSNQCHGSVATRLDGSQQRRKCPGRGHTSQQWSISVGLRTVMRLVRRQRRIDERLHEACLRTCKMFHQVQNDTMQNTILTCGKSWHKPA